MGETERDRRDRKTGRDRKKVRKDQGQVWNSEARTEVEETALLSLALT